MSDKWEIRFETTFVPGTDVVTDERLRDHFLQQIAEIDDDIGLEGAPLVNTTSMRSIKLQSLPGATHEQIDRVMESTIAVAKEFAARWRPQ